MTFNSIFFPYEQLSSSCTSPVASKKVNASHSLPLLVSYPSPSICNGSARLDHCRAPADSGELRDYKGLLSVHAHVFTIKTGPEVPRAVSLLYD